MGDSVFDKLADMWDDVITRTEDPIVKDYQQKERDFLDKVILDNPHESIGLVEIGSGTGRLLLQYLDTTIDPIGSRTLSQEDQLRLKKKIRYVIGVDSSKKMIKKTIQNLKDYGLIDRYKKDVFLILVDAADLARVLPRFLQKHSMPNCPRIFFCMLHTLGNIPTPKRLDVLEAINKVMSPQDSFVVSVWNAERFKQGIEMYRRFKHLIGDIKKKNVFWRILDVRTDKPYYSHWFYPEELKEYLENTAYEIEELEVPKKGLSGGFCILVRASKKMRANPMQPPYGVSSHRTPAFGDRKRS